MPFYEYACDVCENRYDVRRSLREHQTEPAPRCPACGASEVSRVFSAPMVPRRGLQGEPVHPAAVPKRSGPRAPGTPPAPKSGRARDSGPRVRDVIPGYKPGGGG